MIIGFDYTAAAWQGAGIGRYSRELIRAAVEQGGGFRYQLFYATGGLPPDSPYLADLWQLCRDYPVVRAVPIGLPPRLLTIIWQRLRLPLLAEYFTGPLDVLHAPDFVIPPTRARTILTIHDLTFLVQPTCFKPQSRAYLSQVVPRSVHRADHVLVDSQASGADLVRLMDADPSRVSVLYPGINPRFRPLPAEVTEPVRQRLGLPPTFMLFVGTLEPRKNLVRLLEALHLLPTAPPLVIVGRRGWLYEPIFAAVERLALQQRVQFLGFVDDTDLPAVYNLASVFLYPSLYEGFGLPVAEALACGTSVVTSNVASLSEVAGDAAWLVDPLDPRTIADGVQKALQQSDIYRQRGIQQAAQFDWRETAVQLLTCYRTVAERPAHAR